MIANDGSHSLLTLAIGLATVVVFMGACMAISVRVQKLTVVDTAWPLGFVLVLVTNAGDGMPAPQLLLLVLVTLWGLRLAAHLYHRNSGKDEDPRYAELAEADGRSFAQVALTRVFLPQGIAMFLVATPVMVGMNNLGVVGWLGWLGVVVWAVGLFFEAVGDAQLAAYRAQPRESRPQVLDTGLWRYTRHPNYFGDACVWWGLWLAAGLASGWLPGLLTVLCPVAMTVFLRNVTGAKLLERTMSQRPGWDEYAARVPLFFPRPPRS